MFSCGVRHFTEKARLAIQSSSNLRSTEVQQEEINHRLAVPYKNFCRTKIAMKELKYLRSLHRKDLRKLLVYNRNKNSTASSVASSDSHDQATDNAVSDDSDEQTQGGRNMRIQGGSNKRIQGGSNKRKRSPTTDEGDVEKGPETKTQKTSETENSRTSTELEIERLQSAVEFTKKINAISRQFNGQDGKAIPPPEFKDFCQKRAIAEAKANAKLQTVKLPMSIKAQQRWYERKLCFKIINTVLSWTLPPTHSIPQSNSSESEISEEESRKYGDHKEPALEFVLNAFNRDPMFARLGLLDMVLQAKDDDVEALASAIESWESAIENMAKTPKHATDPDSSRTFTKEDLELRRPQIRSLIELKTVLERKADGKPWRALVKAKKASSLAAEVEHMRRDILKVARMQENSMGAGQGARTVSEKEMPMISALPMHMRRWAETKKGKNDVFTGAVVHSGSFSLEMHAKIVGRSKLDRHCGCCC